MTDVILRAEVLLRVAKRVDDNLMLLRNDRFIKCPFKNEDPCNSECALYREEILEKIVIEEGEEDQEVEQLKAFCGSNGVMCEIVNV
jgi:hypothetical protein